MSRTSYDPDPAARALHGLEDRLARVAKSVENMGGVVRTVGYITIGVGILAGIIFLLGTTASGSRGGGGAATGIAGGLTLVLAGFAWGIPLVLVGGYAQMRSLTVQADASRRDLEHRDTMPEAVAAAHQQPTGRFPSTTPGEAAITAVAEMAGEEKVRLLAESEKRRLASMPPADPTPGWFSDPLGAAAQRYWNGTQWTGRIHE